MVKQAVSFCQNVNFQVRGTILDATTRKTIIQSRTYWCWLSRKSIQFSQKMWSLAINFEINFKETLETSGLLAVFVVVAIIAVTRASRRIFKPLNGKRHNLYSSCDKKPIPVENEENDWKVIFQELFSS